MFNDKAFTIFEYRDARITHVKAIEYLEMFPRKRFSKQNIAKEELQETIVADD